MDFSEILEMLDMTEGHPWNFFQNFWRTFEPSKVNFKVEEGPFLCFHQCKFLKKKYVADNTFENNICEFERNRTVETHPVERYVRENRAFTYRETVY